MHKINDPPFVIFLKTMNSSLYEIKAHPNSNIASLQGQI